MEKSVSSFPYFAVYEWMAWKASRSFKPDGGLKLMDQVRQVMSPLDYLERRTADPAQT